LSRCGIRKFDAAKPAHYKPNEHPVFLYQFKNADVLFRLFHVFESIRLGVEGICRTPWIEAQQALGATAARWKSPLQVEGLLFWRGLKLPLDVWQAINRCCKNAQHCE